MRKSLQFAVLLLSAPLANAATDRIIRDPVAISSFLHSIPAHRGDLASRIAAAGLTVEAVTIHKMTREDVAEDPLHIKLGDSEIHVLTKGHPDAGACRILGSPDIIQRGSMYLPQDRTGVWLLTGRCALPD